MRVRPALCISLLALLSGAFGCAAEVSSPDELPEVALNESELFSLPGNILWSMDDIHVCFHEETVNRADYPQFSVNARTWIEETYGRILNLRFVGWGPCPSGGQNMISIRIYDGSGATTVREQNVANSNRRISIGDKYWAPRRDVLIHEFAHALGFDHEHHRTNGDGVCEPAGTNTGETYGTPYDHSSITNSTYCGSWSNLSPWDVVGMRRAYGRKPRGSIVGPRNKCLDVDNPTTGNPPAQQTQVWDCLGNTNQVWSIEHDWHRLTTTWSRGALDVQWGSTSDGTPTWNWERNTSPAQQWNFTGVEVRGMGDLCLDVPNGNFTAGQSLQLWQCVGNENQKWDVMIGSDSRISLRSSHSPSLCVAVDGTLTLQACTNSSTSLSYGDGQIWRGRTRCMDVSNAAPHNGAAVITYGCRASGDYYRQAQEWTFRGPIRGLASKCLHVDNDGGVRASSKTRIRTCDGSDLQTWEYYF